MCYMGDRRIAIVAFHLSCHDFSLVKSRELRAPILKSLLSASPPSASRLCLDFSSPLEGLDQSRLIGVVHISSNRHSVGDSRNLHTQRLH